MGNNTKKTSKWLVIGALILCAILLLWLTFFEYFRSSTAADELGTADQMTTESVE